jgi:hypothetical protein
MMAAFQSRPILQITPLSKLARSAAPVLYCSLRTEFVVLNIS